MSTWTVIREVTSDADDRVKTFLFRLAPPLAALVAGLISSMPVFVLGLVVSELVILPLALGFGGLVAAVAAAWMGTLFSPDRSRSRLMPIVASVELVALVMAGLTLLLVATPLGGLLFPRGIFLLAVPMAVMALMAAVATWRFRDGGPELGKALAVTVALVVLGAVAVVAILSLVALLAPRGMVGASSFCCDAERAVVLGICELRPSDCEPYARHKRGLSRHLDQSVLQALAQVLG